MAGNVKSLQSMIYIPTASVDEFLGIKEPYYAFTGNKTGMKVCLQRYRLCYIE